MKERFNPEPYDPGAAEGRREHARTAGELQRYQLLLLSKYPHPSPTFAREGRCHLCREEVPSGYAEHIPLEYVLCRRCCVAREAAPRMARHLAGEAPQGDPWAMLRGAVEAVTSRTRERTREATSRPITSRGPR